MDDREKARRHQQRIARDKQLGDIEKSLQRATDMINDSQREIQRSRDLMQVRRAQDLRDDEAEDKRNQ